VPRWDNAPQAHSRVSNIDFDIWIWWGTLLALGGPDNIFDINPEWQRMLPAFGNFSWNMYKVPRPQIQISKLIFDTLLWA
jgi:hypothetical protein